MAQQWKNPPVTQETQETHVQSLGWEDPLEEKMETHLSILAWKVPWTEEPGGLQSKESQRVGCSWTAEPSTYEKMALFKGENDGMWTISQYILLKCILRPQPTSEYRSKEVDISISQRSLHCYVHCSTIHDSRDTDIRKLSVNKSVNKENMVYSCSGILFKLKKKKEILSHVTT